MSSESRVQHVGTTCSSRCHCIKPTIAQRMRLRDQVLRIVGEDQLGQQRRRIRNRTGQKSRRLGISNNQPGPLVLVPIRYHVLHTGNDPDDFVTDAQIREQHKQINLDFVLQNEWAERVPKSGRYAFYDRRGNTGVQFEPLDYANGEIDIKTVPVNGIVSSVTQVSSLSEPKSGAINVYIAALPNGLLGQAFIEFNLALVAVGTVGSETSPSPVNPSSSYRWGRTAVHEIGHCFGLFHPFDYGCGGTPYTDMPSVRLPNFEARLVPVSQDVWDGDLCNHDRDARVEAGDTSLILPGEQRPYSCTAVGAANERWEMFTDTMDYASDQHAVHFTGEQSRQMYATVTLSNLFTFTIL